MNVVLTLLIQFLQILTCVGQSTVFNNWNNLTELKVGFITPWDGLFGFDTIASATTMAIYDAHVDGYLPGITVT